MASKRLIISISPLIEDRPSSTTAKETAREALFDGNTHPRFLIEYKNLQNQLSNIFTQLREAHESTLPSITLQHISILVVFCLVLIIIFAGLILAVSRIYNLLRYR
ncbi:hypothetical protein BTUL_0080g00270 [Botrytis tulipae]|uniref:Uncharacterized protein n=1 Tax=Botrytis tulipae TaxID=87230 RepID=A0A4Z1EW01_9HELO|nr:hypothetical protein BTUL_0080g00270 [Botrytis tulipae]